MKQDHNNHGRYTIVIITSGCIYEEDQNTQHDYISKIICRFIHNSILFQKSFPIFGLESEIDEDITTDDALEIDGDGGDRYIEGDEFELHMNANETGYQRRTSFQIDRQHGPMVLILLHTKVQHKKINRSA